MHQILEKTAVMLIGHKKNWDFLTRSAVNGRLAHAYLLTGPDQIGKKTFALDFASWLLCSKKKIGAACGGCPACLAIQKNQHPDLFCVSPAREEHNGVVKTFEIGIAQVRELQRQLGFKPYCSDFKIAVIDEAEKMTREAANSFLKTLEEPSAQSLIFLITSAPQALLPTIVSRCQPIRFLPVAENEVIRGLKEFSKKETEIKKAARFAAGRPGRAIDLLRSAGALREYEDNEATFKKTLNSDLAWRFELAKEMSQDVSAAREILNQWQIWLRDRLLEKSGCAQLAIQPQPAEIKQDQKYLAALIGEIQKTRKLLANSSLNSRLALEVLMTKF